MANFICLSVIAVTVPVKLAALLSINIVLLLFYLSRICHASVTAYRTWFYFSSVAGARGRVDSELMGNKFRAVRTLVDGVMCDSKGEARRYSELLLLERAGEISGLRVHVEFPLEVNGVLVCKYKPDFIYQHNGDHVIEDFKGCTTGAAYRVWVLKWRLMQALYPQFRYVQSGVQKKNSRRR